MRSAPGMQWEVAGGVEAIPAVTSFVISFIVIPYSILNAVTITMTSGAWVAGRT